MAKRGGGNKGGGGGKSSGGGKAPSGGGNKGGGGGSKGGGGKSSGGGGRAAAPSSAPKAAPAARPTSPAVNVSRQRETPKANKAVQVAKTYKSSSSNSKKNDKKDNRVEKLTQQAKSLISGATSQGLADPGKFKNILGKLKDLGKGKRVETLREKKQSAVKAARPAKTDQDLTDLNNIPAGYTQEDLDKAIEDALANQPSGLTEDDLNSAINNALAGFQTQQEPISSSDSYDWESGYQQDLTKWLDQYKTEQADRATDYQKMMTDVASKEGEFDPDLFRGLLGELESSKKRQKEWNERSAREAYKY